MVKAVVISDFSMVRHLNLMEESTLS